MNRKQILATLFVLGVLGVLVYWQVRTWRKFSWSVFWQQTHNVNLLLVAVAIALIYLTYLLRALRWKVFLRPVGDVPVRRLIAPTMIGFCGLALLGRPGEFVRPYLIARKQGLTVSSQIGVWTVERIFDLGGFTLLLAVDIFTSHQLPRLSYFSQVREAGYFLIALTAALTAFAFLMWRWSDRAAVRASRVLAPVSQRFSRKVEQELQTFGRGLHTLHDLRSFLQVLALSLAIWFTIGLAYLAVTNAYPVPDSVAIAGLSPAHVRVLPHEMRLAHVFPLIASSMAGSILQLPAVGGGAQLAVITVLVWVFRVPHEIAVSCGILLWLVTFMSVIPPGLVLARYEHLSLRALSEEARQQEEEADSLFPA